MGWRHLQEVFNTINAEQLLKTKLCIVIGWSGALLQSWFVQIWECSYCYCFTSHIFLKFENKNLVVYAACDWPPQLWSETQWWRHVRSAPQPSPNSTDGRFVYLLPLGLCWTALHKKIKNDDKNDQNEMIQDWWMFKSKSMPSNRQKTDDSKSYLTNVSPNKHFCLIGGGRKSPWGKRAIISTAQLWDAVNYLSVKVCDLQAWWPLCFLHKTQLSPHTLSHSLSAQVIIKHWPRPSWLFLDSI